MQRNKGDKFCSRSRLENSGSVSDRSPAGALSSFQASRSMWGRDRRAARGSNQRDQCSTLIPRQSGSWRKTEIPLRGPCHGLPQLALCFVFPARLSNKPFSNKL